MESAMPTTATASSMDSAEKSAEELLRISVLKTDLVKLFEDYKSSRQGLKQVVVNILFRNRKLTQEKMPIVDETIAFINQYQGTKEGLVEGLRKRRLENADLSREHHKYHANFFGKKPGSTNGAEDNALEGTHGKSALADAFNAAIEKALLFELNDIRLTM